MPTSGSDAGQKAQQAQYQYQARQSKIQSKLGIEQMFENVQDYTAQANSTLSKGIAMLGKLGYLNLDEYNTKSGTADYGVTVPSTSVEEISEKLSGVNTKEQARVAKEWQDKMEKPNINWGDSLSDALYKKDNKEALEAHENTRTLQRYIRGQGGMESLSKVRTNSTMYQARGSALNAVAKATVTMKRDRAKIIRAGLMDSFGMLQAGKHFEGAANYASQAAEYARKQSAMNNFFTASGTALSIIALL